MSYMVYEWLRIFLLIIFAICTFIVLFTILYWIVNKKKVYRWYRPVTFTTLPNWCLRFMKIPLPKSPEWTEYTQLLHGAGIGFSAVQYFVGKRAVQLLLSFVGFGSYAAGKLHWFIDFFDGLALSVFCVAFIFILQWDRWILEYGRRKRGKRIARDLHHVSQHLLYFEGSRLNLHTKLMRCSTFISVIRQEWHEMLNHWYYSAEEAIEGFKNNLGTIEAAHFAETLKAMHVQDSHAFYQLLRERIEDNKIKGVMDREEQKEARSYILFVLAGIPILNTFQIFLYPWVQEGTRLFNSLN